MIEDGSIEMRDLLTNFLFKNHESIKDVVYLILPPFHLPNPSHSSVSKWSGDGSSLRWRSRPETLCGIELLFSL